MMDIYADDSGACQMHFYDFQIVEYSKLRLSFASTKQFIWLPFNLVFENGTVFEEDKINEDDELNNSSIKEVEGMDVISKNRKDLQETDTFETNVDGVETRGSDLFNFQETIKNTTDSKTKEDLENNGEGRAEEIEYLNAENGKWIDSTENQETCKIFKNSWTD